MSTNSTTITPQPSFYGDYEKGEEPTDWIRKYQLSFPSSYSDGEKIARFELQAVTLKEEEIGIMIEEDRGREWGHVKWAKKVLRMAQGFNDTQCHLLDVVLENTPEVLRDFLLDNYTTWTDFETDVAKVSASQLVKAKQRLVTERKLREDVDRLQSQAGSARKTTSPLRSQPSQAPYTSSPAYRQGYRYSTQAMTTGQPQPAAPPPIFQNAAPPQVPQTPQATNPFAPAAPMTRGNLFYGYRGYPQTPTRNRGGSPAERSRLAAQYATIPHHVDSEAGRQAYTQQVQDWHAQNGNQMARDSVEVSLQDVGIDEHARSGHKHPVRSPNGRSTHEHTLRSTTSSIPSVLILSRPIRGIQCRGKRLRTAAVGDLPAVPKAETPTLGEEEPDPNVGDPCPSPNLTDIACSLPSSAPFSAFTSQFNTSVLNTPISQNQEVTSNEEMNDDFVIPTIELNSSHPADEDGASSRTTSDSNSFHLELPFSDSDFSFISAPSPSEFPASTCPHDESLESLEVAKTSESSNVISDVIVESIPVDSSISMLSVVSTVESNPPSDCYTSANEQTVVDLYNVSEHTEPSPKTESTPFITRIILHGPGTFTVLPKQTVGCAHRSLVSSGSPHTSDPKPKNQPEDPIVGPVLNDEEDSNLGEVPDFPVPTSTNVFTRHTDPFNPARVAEVLRQIKIGEDLSPEQRTKRSIPSGLQDIQTDLPS
ncbi:hypothetical protein DEU56DRAFT_761388 [Suillus clintonianus]|uniref:uncharacterized protein n=1 Tax=Suillus clintonianus TaxID=1904413 RepID=UPI001B8737F8|nr:uncharacterized protein DEU56DRAFT_761388 [Suillus clintonianus]KAG2117458.1 hypothetical protein DEU56DRAFT_761388 [Suillus clintonianus]